MPGSVPVDLVAQNKHVMILLQAHVFQEQERSSHIEVWIRAVFLMRNCVMPVASLYSFDVCKNVSLILQGYGWFGEDW